MPSILEVLTALALLVGTALTLIACIGLIRFPDVFCRMHAAGQGIEAVCVHDFLPISYREAMRSV